MFSVERFARVFNLVFVGIVVATRGVLCCASVPLTFTPLQFIAYFRVLLFLLVGKHVFDISSSLQGLIFFPFIPFYSLHHLQVS